MSALYNSIKADSYMVSATVSSWEYSFQAYMTSNGLAANTEAEWYTNLNTFLASSSGGRFRRHVVFNDNTIDGSSSNTIAIARITGQQTYLAKSNDQVKGMDSFRSVVDQYASSLGSTDGEPFGFGPAYSAYEGYKVIETVLDSCQVQLVRLALCRSATEM